MKKQIEFFIDTYRQEAYQHILEIISNHKEGDTDSRFDITVVRSIKADTDIRYLHLRGTWEGYKLFLHSEKVDLNLPENYKYHYSLAHYEED